jgi:hypothetical protein
VNSDLDRLRTLPTVPFTVAPGPGVWWTVRDGSGRVVSEQPTEYRARMSARGRYLDELDRAEERRLRAETRGADPEGRPIPLVLDGAGRVVATLPGGVRLVLSAPRSGGMVATVEAEGTGAMEPYFTQDEARAAIVRAAQRTPQRRSA